MTANWARTLALAAAAVVVALGVNTGVAGASVAGPAARQSPVRSQERIRSTDFGSTPLEQDPAHCKIHYDAKEPHLRKSHNHNAVGVKPYVTCDRSVQTIVLHVQMFKYHDLGLLSEKVGPEFTQDSKHNVARFQQTNVAVTCTNKKSTKWFAITWGKVLENGKWYYSPNPPGFRSEDRTLGCGT
jgi:hypothetical protein